MRAEELDPEAFREVVHQALDTVVAHRIKCYQRTDTQSITAIRAMIEDRLLIALESADKSEMTDEWSWRTAALAIAGEIAKAIIQDGIAD